MVNLILVSLLLIGFESLIPIELSEVFFSLIAGISVDLINPMLFFQGRSDKSFLESKCYTREYD